MRAITGLSVTVITILLFASTTYAGHRHRGDGFSLSFGFYSVPPLVRIDPYYGSDLIIRYRGGYYGDDYYYMKRRLHRRHYPYGYWKYKPYRRHYPYGYLKHRLHRHRYGFGPPGFGRGYYYRDPWPLRHRHR